MPFERRPNESDQDCVSRAMNDLDTNKYPQDQRIAISHSMCNISKIQKDKSRDWMRLSEKELKRKLNSYQSIEDLKRDAGKLLKLKFRNAKNKNIIVRAILDRYNDLKATIRIGKQMVCEKCGKLKKEDAPFNTNDPGAYNPRFIPHDCECKTCGKVMKF